MNNTHTPDTRGRLILMPNTLDLGTVAEGQPWPPLHHTLPQQAVETAAKLTHWVAENAKTARAFLKRVAEITPLQTPLQALDIQTMPRTPKGGGTEDVRGQSALWQSLLTPAFQGHDVGVISEAGLPGVADPGSQLVWAAHQAGLQVWPLSGPSSLVLAVSASGLNGQSFAFQGYLPVDAGQRAQRIGALEQMSRKLKQTQLVIETPYRNAALFAALLQHLSPSTRLAVACGLTLEQGWCRTHTVAHWASQHVTWPDNVPCVFAWLA